MIANMQSNAVRLGWRSVLDQVMVHGSSIVVQRFNQPVAVVLGYEEWKGLIQMKEIETARVRHREMVNDPDTYEVAWSPLIQEPPALAVEAN